MACTTKDDKGRSSAAARPMTQTLSSAAQGLDAGDALGDGGPGAAGLRLLVLMRHAEAKAQAKGGDMDRELTKTGRKAATAVGEWLTRQGVRPDVVIVSPATRTQQTWDALRLGGLSAQDVWSDAAIYDASAEDIVESINAVPDDARTVLVIGHAPGIPQLALSVTDRLELGDEERATMHDWPTAAAAVVGHRGSWSLFHGEEETSLAAFHAPRTERIV